MENFESFRQSFKRIMITFSLEIVDNLIILVRNEIVMKMFF